ncbi:MAG: universal stress protein [Alphaproteobacteria bacterium]
MTIRDILVHADASRHLPARLAYALALAERSKARIAGLYVVGTPMVMASMGQPMTAEVYETLMDVAKEGAARSKAMFEKAVSGAGGSVEWREARDGVDEAVALHGRYADLIIVGQPDPDEPTPPGGSSTVAASAALNAGRPVLVVPYAGAFTPPPRHVVAAWDASRAATRAIHDALPLMAMAEKVTLLSVAPDAEDLGPLPGADMAAHLARHGLDVTARTEQGADSSVADILLNFISDEGAEMLVMGGNGH